MVNENEPEILEHRMKHWIIDVWAQPAPEGAFSEPLFEHLIAQAGAGHRVKLAEKAERIVTAMDQANVEKSLLSAWHVPGRWMISNDQIEAIVRQFPDRFVGVGSVNLEDPVAGVAELERMVIELNFKALRVVPWVWKRPPNDKLFYPLFVKCTELGIPFCTQVGHTGPHMPSDTGRPIPYIDEIALTFPKLKIVCGHIGYPWTDEMIALAWKHKNVYIDTSAYKPKYYPTQLIHFLKTYGQDKVLFGTNFPMLSFEDCVTQALELDLSEAVRRKFLAENARRVFRLG